MSTYLVVDAANMFHRCKHVTTGDVGTKASMALHIMLNALRSSWRQFNADHIVVCLEGGSWRRALYPRYKAQRRVQAALLTQRERDDDEFYFGVMDQFMEFLQKRTNVTVLKSEGVEGDDFIARWVDTHPNDQHVIISGDTDFYQMLSDNVRIYDGVKGWTISTTEVLDEDGNPATTKRTVSSKNDKGKVVKKTVTENVKPPVAEYELFKKIIRGDASDNIMSANPGVREVGSAKKPGIKEAFDDRDARGFHWNNFMLQEWEKPVEEANGEIAMERVRVIDEYNFNKILIDLREQPEEIKELMDAIIVEQTSIPRKQGVGIWFLRFTEEMTLVNIGRNPNEYAAMLSAPYPGVKV